MAPIDTATAILGWSAIAIFLAGAALLVYVRVVSRSSLIVDTLFRFAPGLAVVVAILLLGKPISGLAAFAAVTVLFLLSLSILVPAAFMARVGRETDGYVIVSRGLLEGLHLKLDDLYGPGPARLVMYGVGKKAGFVDTTASLKAGVIGPKRLWSFLPYVFRLTGLGKLRVTRVDPGKEIDLVLHDSFEVFHQHPEGISGCDITRGYLAGIGKALHPELDCQAEETRCAQAGGAHCEFTIRWFEPVKAPAGA